VPVVDHPKGTGTRPFLTSSLPDDQWPSDWQQGLMRAIISMHVHTSFPDCWCLSCSEMHHAPRNIQVHSISSIVSQAIWGPTAGAATQSRFASCAYPNDSWTWKIRFAFWSSLRQRRRELFTHASAAVPRYSSPPLEMSPPRSHLHAQHHPPCSQARTSSVSHSLCLSPYRKCDGLLVHL
jgi:hypothetical protein